MSSHLDNGPTGNAAGYTRSRPDSMSSQGFDDLSLSDHETETGTKTAPSSVDPWNIETGYNTAPALGRKASQDSITASFSDFLDEPLGPPSPPPAAVPAFASDFHVQPQAPVLIRSEDISGASTQQVREGPALTAMSRGPSAVGRAEDVPLVLGVAVVDFNHLIGPTVEFAYPPSLDSAINDDEGLSRLLPFLALPDGAHLSEEDYSYFHCVYSPSAGQSSSSAVPSNTTLFGISCNRQLASKDLLYRPDDVTRTTVQKAVVVVASQPVFGPIRDKLGLVTRAYFAQRDFSQTEILKDFYKSLEDGLMGKDDEANITMGTSLRDLVHKFRHRTLVLLKMLMLQKRIMLYGYPVEKLCTYQYSLLSLMPGLLLELQDSGSPDLDVRKRRARPTSFKSSDRRSLLRYMGLPLHLFGKDAFFQPYLPLQQVDMLFAKTWLTGTTNQIVTQQRDCKYDVLVNIDTMTFEFSDPKLERIVSLTAADRRWMDDVVRTVEETWDVPEGERSSFRGSDDDLRARFEEYICAALAAIKLEDFVRSGGKSDIATVGIGAEQHVLSPFSDAWLKEFKTTSAYEVWNACTDPCLFDICEPKHPCEGPVNVVSDISLRLTEGMHDLKIDQHFATGRDAVTSAFAAGSSSLFKAFDGVRSEVSTRLKEREDAEKARRTSHGVADQPKTSSSSTFSSDPSVSSSSPATLSSPPSTAAPAIQAPQLADVRATLGNIGSGIGSFFGSRVATFRAAQPAAATPATSGSPPSTAGLRPMSLAASVSDRSLRGTGERG